MIKVASFERSRAHAGIQRMLGLRVGGTMTRFYAWNTEAPDGAVATIIETWGPTPGERATAAKRAFVSGDFTSLETRTRARIVAR